MTDYPMGVRLTYADASATTSTGDPGVASGVVNGPPLADDDGVALFVPTFSARDNSREATTIYVAVPNILSVER